jgi:hypothetical protein
MDYKDMKPRELENIDKNRVYVFRIEVSPKSLFLHYKETSPHGEILVETTPTTNEGVELYNKVASFLEELKEEFGRQGLEHLDGYPDEPDSRRFEGEF